MNQGNVNSKITFEPHRMESAAAGNVTIYCTPFSHETNELSIAVSEHKVRFDVTLFP
jgi:hypothetical protein